MRLLSVKAARVADRLFAQIQKADERAALWSESDSESPIHIVVVAYHQVRFRCLDRSILIAMTTVDQMFMSAFKCSLI